MNVHQQLIGGITALGIIMLGLAATPLVFAGRVMPGIGLGQTSLAGTPLQELPGVLSSFEEGVLSTPITISLRGETKEFTMQQLGVSLNQAQTQSNIVAQSNQTIIPSSHAITPHINLNDALARKTLHEAFASKLELPTNASLKLNGSQLIVQKSASGEQVDTISLAEDLRRYIINPTKEAITPTIVSAAAPVQDNEVTTAQNLATSILRDGMKLKFEDKEFELKPFTIRRLLTFIEQADPSNSENTILGIQLEPTGLSEYLKITLAPEINQLPVNARFELKDGRVEQFATPKQGKTINLDASVENINAALALAKTETDLTVDVADPDVADTHDIEALGLTTLLATGETDFRGSPKNRVHNITEGTSRYHGILIPPGSEFSFLQYLGPVDGEHGFKPELVIKQNVTIPEFGGGLCQVSTTAFRAAVESGLKIVQRRNHSYAVRYYGTPGFDATIYPPYTDLRFLNNTPAYILIQTKIEGTKLSFEFWGTDDGRQVTVDGPHPYNRQPDGAVKATLKQTVVSGDGQKIIEDTFYSNYKSPNLFPHVVAANGENNPAVAGATTTPTYDPKPTPTATPTPSPKPKN